MKTLISVMKVLALAAAVFSFASGAWAEHEGDGMAHESDEVLDADTGDDVTGTDVVGEGDVLDGEVIGEGDVVDGEVIPEEEVADDSGAGGGEDVVLETGNDELGVGPTGEDEIIYTMTGEGEEIGGDSGAVDDGAGGEVFPVEAYDSEGNLVYITGDQDAETAGTEIEMTPLMATGAAAGPSLSDTAADQAAIDSGTEMNLDVTGSGQVEVATPVDPATGETGGFAGAAGTGSATRISGGHLAGPAGSQQ